MVFKLFLILFITLFVWLILQIAVSIFRVFSFFSNFRKLIRKTAQQTQNAPRNTMVKCVKCNLYVLDTDAISKNGLFFCSIEHLQSSYQ